jgi:hypothetical protein
MDKHACRSAAAHRKICHLTGPQSENLHFFAQEYSKALGRTITVQDIASIKWNTNIAGSAHNEK